MKKLLIASSFCLFATLTLVNFGTLNQHFGPGEAYAAKAIGDDSGGQQGFVRADESCTRTIYRTVFIAGYPFEVREVRQGFRIRCYINGQEVCVPTGCDA